MNSLSRSLTRFCSRKASRANSSLRSHSPRLPYTVDNVAYAEANSWSISIAWLKNATDSSSRPLRRSSSPSVYDLSAASDGVVACSIGMSNRWMDGRDSPSRRAHRRGDRAELAQHAFAARRLSLLARQALARLAVGRVQRDHVIRAERRDRPLEHGLRADPLARLAAGLVREPLVRGTAHEPQRFPDARIRYEFEER